MKKIFIIALLLMGCEQKPSAIERLKFYGIEEVCLDGVLYYMLESAYNHYTIALKINKHGSVVTCGEPETCERCHGH